MMRDDAIHANRVHSELNLFLFLFFFAGIDNIDRVMGNSSEESVVQGPPKHTLEI
jgi:hypothetical protein